MTPSAGKPNSSGQKREEKAGGLADPRGEGTGSNLALSVTIKTHVVKPGMREKSKKEPLRWNPPQDHIKQNVIRIIKEKRGGETTFNLPRDTPVYGRPVGKWTGRLTIKQRFENRCIEGEQGPGTDYEEATSNKLYRKATVLRKVKQWKLLHIETESGCMIG